MVNRDKVGLLHLFRAVHRIWERITEADRTPKLGISIDLLGAVRIFYKYLTAFLPHLLS